MPDEWSDPEWFIGMCQAFKKLHEEKQSQMALQSSAKLLERFGYKSVRIDYWIEEERTNV